MTYLNSASSQGADWPLSFFYIEDSIFNIPDLRIEKVKNIIIRKSTVYLDTLSLLPNNTLYQTYLLDDSFRFISAFIGPSPHSTRCTYYYEGDTVTKICYNYQNQDEDTLSIFMKSVYLYNKDNFFSYKEYQTLDSTPRLVLTFFDTLCYVNNRIDKEICYFYGSNNSIDSSITKFNYDSLNRKSIVIKTPVYSYNSYNPNSFKSLGYETYTYFNYKHNKILRNEYSNFFWPAENPTSSHTGSFVTSIISPNEQIKIKEEKKINEVDNYIFYNPNKYNSFEIKYGEVKRVTYHNNTKLPAQVLIIADRFIDIYNFDYISRQ